MKHISRLTTLALTVNGALGSGKYDDVLVEDVQARICDGTVFDWLSELGTGFDSSLLEPTDRRALIDEWKYFVEEAEPTRFGVVGNGLCLLAAYILTSMQKRIGELEKLRDIR